MEEYKTSKGTEMRLSQSQLNTYTTCPRKWKFYYIDKLRSPKISSPLFFGSALDEAFSILLLQKKTVLTDLELDLQLNFTAEEMFQSKMLNIKLNGEVVELAQSPFADYYSSDFVPELLTGENVKQLQTLEQHYKLTDFLDFHKQCKEQLAARKKLLEEDQILYNYMTWLTMIEKGKLMIEAYRTDILPQIHRVFDIQKPISIKNEDGDEISGLIDFTASFEDSPSVRYIVDNKTSSKPYPANSVQESLQLATYCEAENTTKAAYVVIEKKLFKKAPNIRTAIIKDDVKEETFQKTFDTFEETVYSIEAKRFDKNEEACFAFGRVCEYYGICKHNTYSGVVKLKEEK